MSANQPGLTSKPYHQQPGEPHKWFDRFQHFCYLGPNRSLLAVYHQLISPTSRSISKAWRQNAEQYHWRTRAAAWDADQHQRFLDNLQSTLYRVSDAAAEALQFQIDLMRGWITDPDGNRIPVTDIYQRRMAAKTLLKWTVDLQALLQNSQQEQAVGEVKITEVRVNRPGQNGSEKK
jgi:hypothetical protein